MEQTARLKAWMDEKGYTNSRLAQELNFSYELVYKVVNEKHHFTANFKWRFAEIFGMDEAIRVFDMPPVSVVAAEVAQ